MASKLHSPKEPGLLGGKAIPGADGDMHTLMLGHRHTPGSEEAVKAYESGQKDSEASWKRLPLAKVGQFG